MYLFYILNNAEFLLIEQYATAVLVASLQESFLANSPTIFIHFSLSILPSFVVQINFEQMLHPVFVEPLVASTITQFLEKKTKSKHKRGNDAPSIT